jgi:hypothetical protein
VRNESDVLPDLGSLKDFGKRYFLIVFTVKGRQGGRPAGNASNENVLRKYPDNDGMIAAAA